MRKLTLLVTLFVVAALIWGLYWVIGATALERGLNAWLDERRAEGWVAEAGDVAVRGFPNRFDATFTGLELADPETQVAWSAPAFQMLALSYKPNHVIMLWPGEQSFSTPDQTIAIGAETMRGSMIVALDPLAPVQSSTIEVINAGFSSTQDWAATLASGQLSMRLKPGAQEPATYDLYIDLSGLTPDSAFMDRLPGGDRLPETIAQAQITATVRYDKPWDRTAIDVARPQPRHVLLEGLTARWGDLDLQATGNLDIGADGIPSGAMEIEATNWRDMIEIARATGALKEEYVSAVTRGLELLASLSGDAETLDVPLSFREGRTYIGPLPVGPAPAIRLP
ncbi:DUF2125 domain-containing protein [Sinisalibacter aestuarii]|uniref:DUF2125 domain-containing protein n=1 Tax=Sinisalibacter aestuarii TaxID=2949426 RepID=A0ABQ5LWB6_9RHOB|nr:DUF2125 domain-containing protein [Sinisalibacter aestuarii]GKY89279.1 hypothetical protein STA1M1_31480 [Sinisalibacter aestuarii]